MELYQLRQFVAVLETTSFTKGAERCAVSQPAISASIAKLEDEIGAQLLVRQKRQVLPTPAGKTLFDTAVNVLRACSAVKAELKRKGDAPGYLRIGVVETLPAPLISTLLKAFRRDQEVPIEVWDGREQDLNARVAEGRLDAAFTIFHADDKTRLASRELFTERYVLLVPKDHRLARATAVRLQDLTGEAFISRTRCETFTETTKLFGTLGVRPRVVYRTDQDSRALELVGAGVGIALMPASYQDRETRAVPVEDFPLHRTIGLRWKEPTGNSRIQDFIAFAASHHWPRGQTASSRPPRRRNA